MHVTSSELRAVQRHQALTRFAILGPVVYSLVELPHGTAGTSLEAPCREAHWGFVVEGELGVRGASSADLAAGEAFHVPEGLEHWFSATDRTVIAGFAPVPPTVDVGDDALAASGFEIVRGRPRPVAPPTTVRPAVPAERYRAASGRIEVEAAAMGAWLFTRAAFGPLSGYTSSWCDLPHWGLVLDGDIALAWEDEVELLQAGDVYHCPAGPPGHRIEVADRATIIDYTPVDGFVRGRRHAEWRRLPEVPETAGAPLARPAAAVSLGPADGQSPPGLRLAREGAALGGSRRHRR